VDLALSDDQQELVQHVAAFFTKECPTDRVRAAEPLGFDAALWRKVVDLGLPTMAVTEANGGGGASLEDAAFAVREHGRHLAPVPLIETCVANRLLDRVGATALLAEAASGAVTTLTLTESVDGGATSVPAGAVADVVLTLDGDALVALRDGTPPRPSPPNLGSSPIADWDLRRADRTVLAAGTGAVDAFARAGDEWRALQAMALAGLAQTALGLGVDYVKQRRAFGVLVGWFQAVQHRLADAVTAVDGAELLAFEAIWALDRNGADAAALASMAFLFAAETSFATCAESLQFHGGYGFTLEYDIQLFYRRAKAWPLALGDRHPEHRRLAALLFEGEG
jgi:alkylation response protein AidB-like acyl-CoA dehydrogenase